MIVILFFNLTSPLLMLWMASMLGRAHVRDMGLGQGYRGPMAMRSQLHWDCAQKTAPQVFKGYGLISAIIVFLWDIAVLWGGFNEMLGMVAGMAIGSITLGAAVIRIEKLVYEECGE